MIIVNIKYELKNARDRKTVNLKNYDEIITSAIKSIDELKNLKIFINEKYFEIENVSDNIDHKVFQDMGKKIIDISQKLGSDLHSLKKQYSYSTQLFKRVYGSEEDDDEEIIIENDDMIDEIEPSNFQNIIIYSRDWTVETIINQINKGNIHLEPKFQRRNAWNDEKRSKLIESLIVGLPIPEIILAESRKSKGQFIVVDGKQRLLSIAGFFLPSFYEYWDNPKLTNLKIAKEFNNFTIEDLKQEQHKGVADEISNSDIRCTVISNYNDEKILYHIFHRLNTGSVPLSMQELRQVLCPGPFANYLYDTTDDLQPIHEIMNLAGPDKRLRDIEFLLKYFAFSILGKNYTGNLRQFLDDFMKETNKNWNIRESVIKSEYEEFNKGINNLRKVFTLKEIGRKFSNSKYESTLNKALLEIQIFYFSKIDSSFFEKDDFVKKLKNNFQLFCTENLHFRNSIEYSTHRINNMKLRYTTFEKFINDNFSININAIPIQI